MDNERQDAIHEKGFYMGEFGNMRVGRKVLENASIDLDVLNKNSQRAYDKTAVMNALIKKDTARLREISRFFYRTNGIYFRVCNYFAQMYRYDWYIVPEIYDKKVKEEKITNDFVKALQFLDNSYIKKTCADAALEAIINGAYYACIVSSGEGVILQQLPIEYCRSRYKVGSMPAVELNMKFFDDKFTDSAYRAKVLKMFPEDVQKGYVLYKQGKIPKDNGSLGGEWYVLTPGSAIKFDFSNGDVPLFVSAIPALLDLDAAQELDRRKQMQKLLKILVQKLPTDKNGDLIFDIDEARDIHNNAVQMLANAVGVDVITTFADMDAIDVSDHNASTSNDELEKVERSLYNAFGISQNIFNAEGSIATTNSILNDEAFCRTLLLQFSAFYDQVAKLLSANPKKYKFRLYMLETTQYNYKELSKMYKEQVQLGFPKELPQVALGHSQSFIINACRFENTVLRLHEIMIPPLMSSTMNSEAILGKSGNSSPDKKQDISENEGGRPEKADNEKSDKTLKNIESMS